MTAAQIARCRQAMAALGEVDDQRYRDLVLMHVSDTTRTVMRGTIDSVSLSRLLAQQVLAAFDRAPSLTPQQRDWLRVAAVHFVLIDDGSNDFVDVAGYDDDAVVVAGVLEECGLPELAKPVRERMARKQHEN